MPPNEKLSLLPASADVDNAFHKKAALSSLTPTAWTEAKLLWTEAKLLGELAFTTVIIQLGFTLPPFLIASHVGRHYGTVYLDGFTLAILTGNLFTLSVLQGLYSAADTLSPQAFGAGNPRQVGLLAMRGFFGSMMLVSMVDSLSPANDCMCITHTLTHILFCTLLFISDYTHYDCSVDLDEANIGGRWRKRNCQYLGVALVSDILAHLALLRSLHGHVEVSVGAKRHDATRGRGGL